MFDLAADPAERHNLIHTQSDLADVMNEILGAWHVRQLTYYARKPSEQYIGTYAPPPNLLERFNQLRPEIAN